MPAGGTAAQGGENCATTADRTASLNRRQLRVYGFDTTVQNARRLIMFGNRNSAPGFCGGSEGAGDTGRTKPAADTAEPTATPSPWRRWASQEQNVTDSLDRFDATPVTNSPEISNIDFLGGTTYDITYAGCSSDPAGCEVADPNKIVAYSTQDGTQQAYRPNFSDVEEVSGSPNTFQVSFNAADAFPDKIVRIASEAGFVQTTEGTGSSTAPDYGVAGAVQIRSAPGGGIHPGFGAGPDLQQLISYNQANGLATVSFDQPIAPGSATSGDCGGPLRSDRLPGEHRRSVHRAA